MVLELKGDLRDTPIGNIAHGVNCQGVMGSGVARALFEKWPEVRSEYIYYCDRMFSPGMDQKPKDLLGDFIEIDAEKTIFNLFTQEGFGPGDKQYIDYAALLLCFKNLPDNIGELAVPRIGAGLAGGDWDIIKNIMVETTQKKGIDLVIYSLK